MTQITGTIKQIQDENGNLVLPITVPAAVKFSDGDTLTDKLQNLSVGNVEFAATCTTAAATAQKEVTMPETFVLQEDARVLIKFVNGISVANATLKIGSGDAKPIYYMGSALEADVVEADMLIPMRYNGSQWELIGGAGGGGSELTITQVSGKSYYELTW